ncbi:MAG TPA: NUDIX domain-containing protein [Tessaracoccus flavescens]|uniref:NUDIX domain-containing protein n=1 Tax=Tessaracoccus flavescens TaxID=399497 RepID=A0A921ENX0_9ACTN|nr:NUDIX domain-containing protein [Tessaracoccus flavescens]
MPVPQFILDLRTHIGHAPLWLMGANALILRDQKEVLLVRRSDTGEWAPVSGIVDPAEHPTDTIVREAMEEAGVQIDVERMLWCAVTEAQVCPNGDQVQFLDHGYRARWVSGEPAVGDDESTAVGWFPVDQLPEPRQPRLTAMVRLALEDPRDVVSVLDEE